MTDPARPMLTDNEIRKLWREAGGGFHGPHVEHAYMEETKFLKFMRHLVPAEPTEDEVKRVARAMKERAAQPLANIPSLEPVLVGSLGDAWKCLAEIAIAAMRPAQPLEGEVAEMVKLAQQWADALDESVVRKLTVEEIALTSGDDLPGDICKFADLISRISRQAAEEQERGLELEKLVTKYATAAAAARNAALEEAAQIVEQHKIGEELSYGHVTEAWIARAIRALKSKSPSTEPKA